MSECEPLGKAGQWLLQSSLVCYVVLDSKLAINWEKLVVCKYVNEPLPPPPPHFICPSIPLDQFGFSTIILLLVSFAILTKWDLGFSSFGDLFSRTDRQLQLIAAHLYPNRAQHVTVSYSWEIIPMEIRVLNKLMAETPSSLAGWMKRCCTSFLGVPGWKS